MKKTPKTDALYIDIGAKNKEEALKLVQPGTYGCFVGEPEEFGNGLLKAKAIDDRAGCAIMLSLLKQEMGDDERIILASYHAGMNAVKGWLEHPEYSSDGETLDVIPFSDTNWYVNKVLETKEIYEKLY